MSLVKRSSDWISVGHRGSILKGFLVTVLVLAPLWLTFGVYLMVRWHLAGISTSTLAWSGSLPWAFLGVGVLGCLLLPLSSLFSRLIVTALYVLAMPAVLIVFGLTVGCLLTSECL